MLIQLSDDLWVNPEEVVAVKSTGKNGCALFFEGQSAIDGGFHIPYGAEETAQEINDAIEEMYTEDEEEDETSEPAPKIHGDDDSA